jgi:hypothetical protein
VPILLLVVAPHIIVANVDLNGSPKGSRNKSFRASCAQQMQKIRNFSYKNDIRIMRSSKKEPMTELSNIHAGKI